VPGAVPFGTVAQLVDVGPESDSSAPAAPPPSLSNDAAKLSTVVVYWMLHGWPSVAPASRAVIV